MRTIEIHSPLSIVFSIKSFCHAEGTPLRGRVDAEYCEIEEIRTCHKIASVGVIGDGTSMIADLKEPVTLSLSKAACLVLFELLTMSYEHWRKSNPNDDSPSPMLVPANEHSDRIALWQLEGALERTLPELFASNYVELVHDSKIPLENRA